MRIVFLCIMKVGESIAEPPFGQSKTTLTVNGNQAIDVSERLGQRSYFIDVGLITYQTRRGSGGEAVGAVGARYS